MTDSRTIDTQEKLDWLFENLNDKPTWVFDIEGTSLEPTQNKMIGIGFSWQRNQGAYLVLRKYLPIIGLSDFWGPKQQEVLARLKEALLNLSFKGAHNAKYDTAGIFCELGYYPANVTIDTMLLLAILNPDKMSFSLDTASFEYEDLRGYKDMVKGKELWKLPIKELTEYNCRDVDLTWRIVEDNLPSLEQDEQLSYLFSELVMPLCHLLTKMEVQGIRIDQQYAKKLHVELYGELEILSKEIFEATGVKLNVRSHDQLSHVLYSVLKLPILGKTDKKKPSTSKEVLKLLQKKVKNPVLDKIIKYRSLAASKTAFVDSLLRPMDRKDNLDKGYLLDRRGYIHGNYKMISKTGRLRSGRSDDGSESENSRNLQNTPRDKRFRRVFLPDEGHLFCGADYAQLELRVLAHVCKDGELLRAFQSDYDPHCLVGASMAGLSYEEVLDGYRKGVQRYVDIRNLSKNIGFGWVYMAGDGRFAYLFPGRSDKEKLNNEIAAKERYFDRFNRIIPWRVSAIDFARKNGYIRLLSGRVIPTPLINSEDKRMRSHAEKQCVNAHIQGPASDLTCMSGVQLDDWITANNIPARVLNFIHDAIYTSVKADYADQLVAKKREIMETPKFGITTKMKADIHIWDRWEGVDAVSEKAVEIEEVEDGEIEDGEEE